MKALLTDACDMCGGSSSTPQQTAPLLTSKDFIGPCGTRFESYEGEQILLREPRREAKGVNYPPPSILIVPREDLIAWAQVADHKNRTTKEKAIARARRKGQRGAGHKRGPTI